jgi:hypothetical protein
MFLFEPESLRRLPNVLTLLRDMSWLLKLVLLLWLFENAALLWLYSAIYGPYVFIASFLVPSGLAVWKNKARKAQKHEAFDDRVPIERREKALSYILEQYGGDTFDKD